MSKKEFDFTQAKQGALVPAAPNKTRITIRLDTNVLNWFRNQVHEAGGGSYQTLINEALRQHIQVQDDSLKETLRKVIREEIVSNQFRLQPEVHYRMEKSNMNVNNRLDMYCERMQEIARRMDVVNAFLGGSRNALYLLPTVECIYLQFRNILELIATASLTMNEDAKAVLNEEGYRAWHAGDILAAVERVNPSFYYPQPVRPKKHPHPNIKHDLKSYRGDYLTKEKFITLYDLCSKVIHTPSPFDRKAYLKDGKKCEALLKDAEKWVERIKPLLYHHTFKLAGDEDFMYVGHMVKDKFHVATFQKMENLDKDSSPEEVEEVRAMYMAPDKKRPPKQG